MTASRLLKTRPSCILLRRPEVNVESRVGPNYQPNVQDESKPLEADHGQAPSSKMMLLVSVDHGLME